MTTKHKPVIARRSSATIDPVAQLERASEPRLKFGKNNTFQTELRRRVDAYLQSVGRPQRDCPQMYAKTAILLVSLAVTYTLLVFFARSWWQALPLGFLLGLVMAGIGLNIQHDGGHQAYSKHPWVNKLMAMTLDLIGASSYNWHWKHVAFHHTYVNITGHDTDIDLGIIARVTPHQRHFFFHRWQQYYLWLAYGLVTIKWHLFGDFGNVITGRIGSHRYPRPKGWEMVIFLGGKALFFTLAFVVPMLLHPPALVMAYYVAAAFAMGFSLNLVFQLAHAVEEAEFPLPSEETGHMENAWAIHQAETTVNFARKNRVLSWFLGGLNFQVEHHLCPKICHVNYPAITKIVEDTCREFGVTYRAHKSFWAGIVAHFLWLRKMGLPNPAE